MDLRTARQALKQVEVLDIPARQATLGGTRYDYPAHKIPVFCSSGGAGFDILYIDGINTNFKNTGALALVAGLQKLPYWRRPRVVYFEHPGYGHNFSTGIPYYEARFGMMRHAAREVLTRSAPSVRHRPKIVMGHSMGGAIATLLLQEQYAVHAGRSPDLRGRRRALLAGVVVSAAWNFTSFEMIGSASQHIFSNAQAMAETHGLYGGAGAQAAPPQPQLIADFLAEAAHHNLVAWSRGDGARQFNIGVPFVVIHGAEDTLVPPALARQLHQEAEAPEKKLVVLASAGHTLPPVVITELAQQEPLWLRATLRADTGWMLRGRVAEGVAAIWRTASKGVSKTVVAPVVWATRRPNGWFPNSGRRPAAAPSSDIC